MIIHILKSIVIFLLGWLVLHFIFIGLYHVELLFKPYTEIGKVILFWIQQLIAFLFSLTVGFLYYTKQFSK